MSYPENGMNMTEILFVKDGLEVMGITIPKELNLFLKKLAKEKKTTKSQLIRQAIQECEKIGLKIDNELNDNPTRISIKIEHSTKMRLQLKYRNVSRFITKCIEEVYLNDSNRKLEQQNL